MEYMSENLRDGYACKWQKTTTKLTVDYNNKILFNNMVINIWNKKYNKKKHEKKDTKQLKSLLQCY